MRSRLFQAVVGAGITLGTLNGGCLGESATGDAPPVPQGTDPGSTDTPRQNSTNGEPAPSGTEVESDSQTSGGLDAGTTLGGGQGAGSSGSSTSSATTGAGAAPGPEPPSEDGAGGLAGAAGDSETATTTDGGDDPVFDPYCDAAWPTTKGYPEPPSCVDPNHECTDAGYPARCLPPLSDGSCSYSYLETQSPFCIDRVWQCAPGLVSATECRCFGPLPEGEVCGENGPEPRDS